MSDPQRLVNIRFLVRRDDIQLISGGRLIESDGSNAWLGGPVDIRIRTGSIEEITPAKHSSTRQEGVVDATGLLLVPGLINGHTHSHEGFHRGRYPKLPLERWMHYVRPPLEIPLTTEDIYLRTILSGLDAIRGGATTIVDDVGLPTMEDDHLDAVEKAYEDIGVRAFIAPTMFDRPFSATVPFVEDELPPDVLRHIANQPRVAPETALKKLVHRMNRQRDIDSPISYAVAASAPQRCSDDYFTALADAARDAEAPIVTHVNETRLQAVTAQLLYGETMVEHLDSIDVLDPALSIIHGVWLTESDLTRLAQTQTTLQHNPVSNLRLGSGLAPIAQALASNVNVSLGSDGIGSAVGSAMTTVMRTAALLSTLRDSDIGWVRDSDVLQMATEAGAKALGVLAGKIAPGFRADIIGLSMTDPAFTPLNNPLRQFVYADQQLIDTVIVDGGLVLYRGNFQTLDANHLGSRIRRSHTRLLPYIKAADAYVDEHLAVPFGRIEERADLIPIPGHTAPAKIKHCEHQNT